MSVTLGQLVDEVSSTLLGFTHQQEAVTYLTSTVDASAATLPINDVSVAGRGQVEIGDELIYVDRVSSRALEVPPFGRGYRSTTAASHASGSRVLVKPAFPRQRIRDEINNTVVMVGQDVYDIRTATLTFEPSQVGYELPAADFPNIDDVLAVHWDPEDPTGSWVQVKRWRLNRYADTTQFPSGVSLDLWDVIRPGSTVRVTYRPTVEAFAADAADSTALTSTGLPESCRDLVVMGAVANLAWGVDLGKASERSVSADAITDTRGPGTSSQFARQLFQKFQFRLDAERAHVLSRVPVGIRYER